MVRELFYLPVENNENISYSREKDIWKNFLIRTVTITVELT